MHTFSKSSRLFFLNKWYYDDWSKKGVEGYSGLLTTFLNSSMLNVETSPSYFVYVQTLLVVIIDRVMGRAGMIVKAMGYNSVV